MFIKENQLKTFLCCVTLQFSVYMVNTSLLCFPRAVIPCLPNLLLLIKMTVTNQGGTAFSGLFFFSLHWVNTCGFPFAVSLFSFLLFSSGKGNHLYAALRKSEWKVEAHTFLFSKRRSVFSLMFGERKLQSCRPAARNVWFPFHPLLWSSLLAVITNDHSCHARSW